MERYLITIAILHICALFIYELLLKNTTFLKGNRAYLLIVPVILWVIPFINISVLNTEPIIEMPISTSIESSIMNNQKQVSFDIIPQTATIAKQEEPTMEFSWWWIYISGVFISLLAFSHNYYRLNSLKKKGIKSKVNGIPYLKIPNSKVALSFMGNVLIGDTIKEENLSAVVTHEQVHITQKHHIDLLFYQLLNIILWFNPFNYLFLNRLKLTHELLADKAVADQLGKKQYTEILMNETFDTSAIPFANMFYSFKTIKNRVSMLYRKSTPKIARLRYTSIVVILLSVVIYTSCTTVKEKESTLENQISELNERIKALDSISLKDLKSLDNLQNTITSYTIDEGSEYAKIIKEEQRIIDSLYLKAYNNGKTDQEYSEFVERVQDSIDKTKAQISEDGKTLTFDYIEQEEFNLPLYSEFKFGQKDYYKGISKDDSLWYNTTHKDFWSSKKDVIIDSTNAIKFAAEFVTFMKTPEGQRFLAISQQINFNGASIVIDDSKEPRDIMTIIEKPDGKVMYGTFPSQSETGLSDIKYEVFKHWAVQNYPSLKSTVVYSEGAIKDYYNGAQNQGLKLQNNHENYQYK